MANERLAYHYATDPDGGGFVLVVCMEGEGGYHIYGTRPVTFEHEENARESAVTMNRRLGLSDREAAIIIASTMNVSRRRRA